MLKNYELNTFNVQIGQSASMTNFVTLQNSTIRIKSGYRGVTRVECYDFKGGYYTFASISSAQSLHLL